MSGKATPGAEAAARGCPFRRRVGNARSKSERKFADDTEKNRYLSASDAPRDGELPEEADGKRKGNTQPADKGNTRKTIMKSLCHSRR